MIYVGYLLPLLTIVFTRSIRSFPRIVIVFLSCLMLLPHTFSQYKLTASYQDAQAEERAETIMQQKRLWHCLFLAFVPTFLLISTYDGPVHFLLAYTSYFLHLWIYVKIQEYEKDDAMLIMFLAETIMAAISTRFRCITYLPSDWLTALSGALMYLAVYLILSFFCEGHKHEF